MEIQEQIMRCVHVAGFESEVRLTTEEGKKAWFPSITIKDKRNDDEGGCYAYLNFRTGPKTAFGVWVYENGPLRIFKMRLVSTSINPDGTPGESWVTSYPIGSIKGIPWWAFWHRPAFLRTKLIVGLEYLIPKIKDLDLEDETRVRVAKGLTLTLAFL